MLAARMWPYITEAGEWQAKALLPDMLAQNKPTWMTKLGFRVYSIFSNTSKQLQEFDHAVL